MRHGVFACGRKGLTYYVVPSKFSLMAKVYGSADGKVGVLPPRLETRSLASRAKEALLQSIRSGGFVDGRLPREERLAEILGVSRTTVREALRSLEQEGIISRQRGIGTRVNPHIADSPVFLNQVVGFYDMIAAAGFDPCIAWTRVSEGKAPPDVAGRLSREDAQVLFIERLFLASGDPAIHITEMVLIDFVAEHAKQIPNAIFEYADRYCRARIDHTVVEVIPVLATGEQVRLLPVLVIGEPLLRLIETHYTIEGVPFIVSHIHVVDRFMRFSVVRRRL
jgi:GntR family transcriptional regulator